MEEYTKFLLDRGYVSAQLLLTRGDFVDRRRYTNAFNALELLLKKGAVPIVNENDTVSLEELKLGDNDTLGAYLAAMLHANLLILLTDVDGLYTANPSKDKTARRIDRIDKITKDDRKCGSGHRIVKRHGRHDNEDPRGENCDTCGSAGIHNLSSGENPIVKAVSGEGVGTLFTARYSLKTKLQWLAFYAQASGNLFVDAAPPTR